MMGHQPDTQQKLFYTCFNLEKRVRKDHILRKVAQHIDFDFIYKQVEDKYGTNGNVSVPPPVILKMMLLLTFYNVRSERELMQTIPERLDRQSLKRYLNKSYRELERRLEQPQDGEPKMGKVNRKHVSTTDPDASVVRMGPGRSKLRYKIHRAVDEKKEVIPATEVTTGEVNEAHRLTSLIDQHQHCTQKAVKTAVADRKYGTIDNYLACCDRKIAPHFESFDKGHRGSGRRKDIFEPSDFVYNPDEDLFVCPAGELLERRKFRKKRNHFEYALPAKVCNQCQLKEQCTRSKQGRTIKRHIRQDELDRMLSQSESRQAKRDIAKRQHLMERSFARSKRYGYKRARWRRLWRVQIQEYLTAAMQNIIVLVSHIKEQDRGAQAKRSIPRPKRPLLCNDWFVFKSLLSRSVKMLAMATG